MANNSPVLTFRLKGVRSMTQDTLEAEVTNALNKLAAHMSVKLGSATFNLDDVVIKQELDGTGKGTTATLQLHDGPQTLTSTGFPARIVLAIAINLEYFYDLTLTVDECSDLRFAAAALEIARMLHPDMPEPSFLAELHKKVMGDVDLPSTMDFRK